MQRNRGFTLIEVLVALAILAIALAAAMRATGSLISATTTLKEHVAATWIAQNRLAEHVGMRDFPDPGTQSGEAVQAGVHFGWREDVSGTPNPDFRRIEVRVFAGTQTDYASATLTGYLARASK